MWHHDVYNDTTDPKRRILDFTHEHISYRPGDSIEVIETSAFQHYYIQRRRWKATSPYEIFQRLQVF